MYHQVKPFDDEILKSQGVTYNDSFLREIAAKQEESFESSETFISRVVKDDPDWRLEREFVPQYPFCEVKYDVSIMTIKKSVFIKLLP